MLYFTFELKNGNKDYLVTDCYYQYRKRGYDYESFDKIIECSEAVRNFMPGFSKVAERCDEEYSSIISKVIITSIDNTLIRVIDSHFIGAVSLKCARIISDRSGFICYDAVPYVGKHLSVPRFSEEKGGYHLELDYGFRMDTVKI